MSAAARLPSLRTHLARHVLWALALMWLMGTAITTSVAYYYAAQAFDRSLLDDAYALASSVQAGPGSVRLVLSEGELKSLLFDQSETMYHAVFDREARLISGDPWLQPSPRPLGRDYEFSYASHAGKGLRVVTVYRGNGPDFRVMMAQTTRSRTLLLQRVVAFSLAPQGLLLLLLAWWLRRLIKTDLRPLSDLQDSLNQRGSHELSAIAVHATTSDIQHLQSALNSLMQRVNDGVQAQREFAGNVAHELRTPLAGIRALAEYGLTHADPQVWHGQLKAIAASEARASHMVEQLLALAWADESRHGLQLRPTGMDALVRRIVLEAVKRADSRGVDLGMQGLDREVTIPTNEGLVEGVLNNLLDNALRYGKPADGTTPTVTVALTQAGGRLQLAVIDNGPGIPTEGRRLLVQRWQQAGSGIDAGQGVGLGLAIVARYAALLGAGFSLQLNPEGPGLCAVLAWEAAA
jgi:two-component system sensor histidine kinase TctE